MRQTIGWRELSELKELEELANKLGFELTCSRFSDNSFSLIPLNEELPIYARDASMFAGYSDNCRAFLQGLQFARDYDRMLGVSEEKLRARKEQDWKNQNLIEKLKAEQSEDFEDDIPF